MKGVKMKTVVVGISGGVDSSVAALLLKEQGYQVIGLFMRNWDSSINNDYLGNPNLNNNICPQEQDYNDAKAVCDKLNIPLHRIDFVKEYWDNVFTYFLEELKKGRTPNPDIMCNKYIKFDLFIKQAKKLGADYIATGHYARIIDGKLSRAVDLNKDQSYFLAYVNKENFVNVLFPIGELEKIEVRKIAQEHNLITAQKKDSTGICFIGERNFSKFLENYLPNQPGKIINIETKEEVGEHLGLMYYTIGQRRGLNLGGNNSKSYVVEKDLKNNILYVASGEENKYLYSTSAIIEDFNFLTEDRPSSCSCKFRYRQKDIPIQVEYLNGNILKLTYKSAKAVTPGQFCVLYQGTTCLGGGMIKEVHKEA
ncbi:MAG: tRNA 2-thiouridine(34) synthase MnmA [Erysipelotrichaceae bacterium]|nr:tRNA 2-thiouridine(34) synthase MnmA [Erysipelotrichaceae bacterium]